MTPKQCEPGGVTTAPARNSESHKKHIADAASIQFIPVPLCESQLCAAGWADPVELRRVADACGLDVHDFWDRLCGALIGYLRVCGGSGEPPTLDGASNFLREYLATFDVAELEAIIATPIPPGESVVDHVRDVQRFASERAEADARYATQCGLREVIDLVTEFSNWRDELHDFRQWTRRQKRRVAREFRACRMREVQWHV